MRWIGLLLLTGVSVCAQTPLFSQVDGMLASLSRMTGWKVKRKVPSELLPRAKFAQMVQQGVAEAERDKETRTAELTLKMFGLVPWDYRLAQESADLIEEQAAAFYDVRKKKLFVLDNVPDGPEQRVALAHELAHALADQQYGIEKYLEGAKDDDATTARESVIEGQASWLSWAYMAQQAGGRPEVPRQLLEELADVGGRGEDFPVLERTPLYIRESLTFPYTEGMKFQDAIYRKAGAAAFDQVFREPPLSTQEILHPESYADDVRPSRPTLPKATNVKLLTEGDVGEFDYSAILRQFAQGDGDRERKVAGEWRGGAYRLYEDKRTKAPLLMHISEWSSPDAAEAFLRAYLDVLRRRWEKIEVRRDSDGEVAGTGDRGDFLLRIRGASVLSIEGISTVE